MREVIAAILGTVLGFALSECAQWRRDRSSARKQHKSVRALVSLEIDSNLRLLNEFWASAKLQKHPSPGILTLAHRFIDQPFPAFKADAFRSQYGVLTSALPETEIRACFAFHDDLTKVAGLRDAMFTANEEERESWNRASGGTGMVTGIAISGVSQAFDRKAPDFWTEAEAIITGILKRGNPLTDEKTKIVA